MIMMFLFYIPIIPFHYQHAAKFGVPLNCDSAIFVMKEPS